LLNKLVVLGCELVGVLTELSAALICSSELICPHVLLPLEDLVVTTILVGLSAVFKLGNLLLEMALFNLVVADLS
jgi:hypothetical protein